MLKISIVGFGRFGKTLYRLIKDDFAIMLYDTNQKVFTHTELAKNTVTAKDLSAVYKSDVVFFAVPISAFEQVINSHKKYFRDNHVLIDVLSVKQHPAKIFHKYLKDSKTQALLTHPMFGPDSSKDGFKGLPIILDKYKTNDSTYGFWKEYFESKKLRVIEMTARQHDEIAANTQGLTHFIGRLLDTYGFQSSSIDSLGTKKLLEVKDQTCNDKWQLFNDLQQYNQHTKRMHLKLGIAYDKLYNKLLPKQVSVDYITFGIQGGKGSFNEEAIRYFLKRTGPSKYKIKYLYTSGNVLRALHEGKIDRGQFAIHNSVGGIVEESIKAMAMYKFKIVEQFAIKISHALMIRSDADINEVTNIMSHPQVFAQCKKYLSEKYPNFKPVSGKGKLIDHALVAKYLSEKKLDKNIATMGSKVLAQIYDLKIIEDNLQDAKENYT